MALLLPWYRHSPSSGNRYRESPDSFLWRYGFGKFDDERVGRLAVGDSVEKALAQHLLGQITATEIVGFAQSLYDTQMQGEVTPERDDIEALCKQGLAGLHEIAERLVTYQATLQLGNGEKFGLRYGIKCKTDFGFESFTVDLKITWRMPSDPKFGHVCQCATYHAISGKGQKLLYVTPKKHNLVSLDDDDLKIGWSNMLASFEAIEKLDDLFDNPREAMKLIPLNLESFYWSANHDRERIAAAHAWGVKIKEAA